MVDIENAIVEDITDTLGDAPTLHELAEGETETLKIKYVKSNRRDFEGIAVSFHFGSAATEVVEAVEEIVEPQLDKRKFRVPTSGVPKYKQNKTWTIGTVDVDSEGCVVDHEMNEDYLKPSER